MTTEQAASVDVSGVFTAEFADKPKGTYKVKATLSLTDGTSASSNEIVVRVGSSRALRYVAIGDSYSAGDGLDNYLTGAGDQDCHRSKNAYPMLLKVLGSSLPYSDQVGSLVDFRACAGAILENLLAAKQHNLPLQIESVLPDTDLITLTIGGNDLEFAQLLQHCLTTGGCEDEDFLTLSAEKTLTLKEFASWRLALLAAELPSFYRRIIDQAGSGSQLFVGGYPPLFGDRLLCNTIVGPGERKFIKGRQRVFNDLTAAAIAEIDKDVGDVVHFVDVFKKFEGHVTCDNAIFKSDTWVNSLEPSAHGFIDSESFHPTEEGQRQYAKAFTAEIGKVAAELNDRIQLEDVAVLDPIAATSARTEASSAALPRERELPAWVTAIIGTDLVPLTLAQQADLRELAVVQPALVADRPLPERCSTALAPGESGSVTFPGLRAGSRMSLSTVVPLGRTLNLPPTTVGTDGVATVPVAIPGDWTDGIIRIDARGTADDGSLAVATVIVRVAGDPTCPPSDAVEIINNYSGDCLSAATSHQMWAPLTMASCADNRSQLWTRTTALDDWFTLRNVDTGLCADVPASSLEVSIPLIQSTCTASDNQMFRLSDFGKLEVFHNRLALDQAPDSRSITQRRPNGNSNQRFTVSKPGDGRPAPLADGVQVVSQYDGTCLDVPSGEVKAGLGLHMVRCDGQRYQQWILRPFVDEWFSLHSAASGMCLDLPTGTPVLGADLAQYPCHGGANQLFRWTPDGLLESRYNGLVLDRPLDGRQTISQFSAHHNFNQRFTLVHPMESMPRVIAQGTSLVSHHDGSCLVRGSDGSISFDPCTEQPGQQWTMQPWVDDWFVLRDTTTALCVDVAYASVASGASVGTYACSGADHQLFRWKGSMLQARHSAMALTFPTDGSRQLVQAPAIGSLEQDLIAAELDLG